MPFLKTKQRVDFTQSALVTVASTASETTLVGTGEGSLTIQKDSLAVGKTFRVSAKGFLSTTGTPTLRLKVKLGSTVILDSGTATMATITNESFSLNSEFSVYSIGSSGTVNGQGIMIVTGSSAKVIAVPTASGSAITVDSTANQTISVTATWGTSSSSNTITCTNLVVEELN